MSWLSGRASDASTVTTGGGSPVERRELDLLGSSVRVDVDDGTNIADLEAFLCWIFVRTTRSCSLILVIVFAHSLVE
jgi:hypothetical protein